MEMSVIPSSLPRVGAVRPVRGAHGPSRAWIAAAVGIPASAVFMYLAVRGADLGAVWQSLENVQLLPVLGAVGCMGVVYWLQAERWRRIALTRASQWRFFEMVIGGVAVNNVLPGRLGDLLRARWVSRGAFPYGRGIATVVLDRGFDLVVLFGFLLATVPFVTDARWIDRIVVGTLVAVALLAIGILGSRSYTRRRPGARRRGGVVHRFVRDVMDGLSEPLGVMRTQELVGFTVAAWLVWTLAALLVARAVGLELTVVEAVFVTAAINLGVAIPSSPGFVGTYQWLGVSALALFGIGQESALAFAIVLQAVWYVPTTLAGLVLLLTRTRRAWNATAAVPRVGA
jgi:glycosyltransferase 2 family protein